MELILKAHVCVPSFNHRHRDPRIMLHLSSPYQCYMIRELAAVALSTQSERAVRASQTVASSMLSSLSQLTQFHHKVFALHYMCAVVLCAESTGCVAAGAWAQGSSEIQLASGCRMKAVILMKTDSLGVLLSYAIMYQCRKISLSTC